MSETMGQILDKRTEPRVLWDEEGDNGLILCDKYIPEELIAEILCYVDAKSLLNSQLVCKRWKSLIQTYVWRKKDEIVYGSLLHSIRDLSWQVYYSIYTKKPFERNLLKNHSGQEGVTKHWEILSQGGDHWRVENPPVGVPPLPSDQPIFEGKQYCFATSYYNCSKQQTVDLIEEGLCSEILDKVQPPILVSEWYSCRWDCPASYEFTAKLLNVKNEVVKCFGNEVSIKNMDQNQWHYISFEFTDYGPGVEKVILYHGGTDNLFWAGHYGSKMAGSCVMVKLPDLHRLSGKIQKAENKPRQIDEYLDARSDDDNSSENEEYLEERRNDERRISQ